MDDVSTRKNISDRCEHTAVDQNGTHSNCQRFIRCLFSNPLAPDKMKCVYCQQPLCIPQLYYSSPINALYLVLSAIFVMVISYAYQYYRIGNYVVGMAAIASGMFFVHRFILAFVLAFGKWEAVDVHDQEEVLFYIVAYDKFKQERFHKFQLVMISVFLTCAFLLDIRIAYLLIACAVYAFIRLRESSSRSNHALRKLAIAGIVIALPVLTFFEVISTSCSDLLSIVAAVWILLQA